MPYRLFPYERRLGTRELKALGLEVEADRDNAVAVSGEPGDAIFRATYFEGISAGPEVAYTHQARVEARHLSTRGRQAPRQATRYGLHGVHEYKGKFNPQVVRALCNVVDPCADLLVDPFCGCGTALIEGLRLRMAVLGVDRSPLASFLATAKVAATARRDKLHLAGEVADLAEQVADALNRGQTSQDPAPLGDALGQASEEYLRRWFTAPAYAGLSRALRVLHEQPPSTSEALVRVGLSSILRTVSLQLPEDLRIRRRPEPYVAPPLAPLFTDAVDEIRRGLLEMDAWEEPGQDWRVMCSSADDSACYRSTETARRRVVITSPPYAMALPYVDTDRLSLVALGLTRAKELGRLERELVGSREWTRREQGAWDVRRLANHDRLPDVVTRLLSGIEHANSDGSAGFRRAAMPSLLYRYFARMGTAIESWTRFLAAGEAAVLIVGHNRTTAGGEQIRINTPELLGHVAESRGFTVEELIALETWPRYGMHSANGVAGEDALVIKRRR